MATIQLQAGSWQSLSNFAASKGMLEDPRIQGLLTRMGERFESLTEQFGLG